MSFNNLFLAWQEFKQGKRKRLDVQQFEFNLEDNLFQLHQELTTRTYQHSYYTSFYIQDPKLRHIHKACVRDRVIHQAIFRVLYPIFDKSFIFDSYSCRFNKGTHRAVNNLKKFARKLHGNNRQNIFILKCDIKKFFDSIDQDILLNLIKKKIQDDNAIWLIEKIIRSFEKKEGKALPLGNVTSQLFANVYLNELDQFMKHKLKIRYYLRYCDDFVILEKNRPGLKGLIWQIDNFLRKRLKLELHIEKLVIRKYHQGMDFLGYIVLPHHRVLRTKTKKRIFKKLKIKAKDYNNGIISKETLGQSLQSYLGVLSHANSFKLSEELKNDFWFWINE